MKLKKLLLVLLFVFTITCIIPVNIKGINSDGKVLVKPGYYEQTYLNENNEKRTITWAKGVDAPLMSSDEDKLGSDGYFEKEVYQDITFNIDKINITDLILSNDSYTYDNTEKIPDITVKYNDTILIKDVDYTLTIPTDLINAGIKEIKVEGINNYKGTLTKTYIINKIPNEISNLEYNNGVPSATAKFGTVYFKYNKKDGSQMNLTNPTLPGKYVLVAYTKETTNYLPATKELDIVYRINIDNIIILGLKPSYEYTGKEITPKFTIKLNGTVLGSDAIKITYTNNINLGDATITIEGINSYQGTVEYAFRIVKSRQIITDFKIVDNKPQAFADGAPIKFIYYTDKDLTNLLEDVPTEAGTYYVKAVIDDENYEYYETSAIEFIIKEKDTANTIATIVVASSFGLIALGIGGYFIFKKFKSKKRFRRR